MGFVTLIGVVLVTPGFTVLLAIADRAPIHAVIKALVTVMVHAPAIRTGKALPIAPVKLVFLGHAKMVMDLTIVQPENATAIQIIAAIFVTVS